MSQVIKIKHSTTPSNEPASLETGELAINVTDGSLFFGSATTVHKSFKFGALDVTNDLTVVGEAYTDMIKRESSNSTTTKIKSSANKWEIYAGHSSDEVMKIELGQVVINGEVEMGANKITGLGDPTLAQDGATKAYVDLYATSGVSSVAALTLGVSGTDLSSTVADGTTTPVITLNVPTASASNRGALSSTDWTTFNNKTTNTGTVTSVAAITLGTTGTDLSSTVADGTTAAVVTLNVPTSSASNRGALSSTDWTTFNNKTTNTGTVTSVAISGSDGIDIDSGSPITSSGTIALGLSSVPNSSLANSTVSYGGISLSLGGTDATPAFNLSDATAYPGTSTLIATGTITTGVWNSNRLFTKVTALSCGEQGDYVTFGDEATETECGLIYCYNGSEWVIADANVLATSTGLLAVAMGAGPAEGMLLRGLVGPLPTDPGSSGDILYISETAGVLTNSAPTTAGAVVRVVGYAIDDAPGIWWNPDNTWVELS